MKKNESDKYALLIRLNPKCWPTWERHITEPVWFKTGRRKPEGIQPGIPVVVLGTQGRGILAEGKTETGVVFRCDPDWEQGGSEKQRVEWKKADNRVCVTLKRVTVPIEELKRYPMLERLPNKARDTITWLNSEQYYEIMSLIRKRQP